MACCGGGIRPRNVRHQAIPTVSKQSENTVAQKRVVHTKRISEVSPTRQYLVNREQCVKCGYPMMLVNISGRERLKCSNVNCDELK